eukprot:scaffold1393_cov111-Isochrysis_galbana.AAC.3
MDTGGTAPTPLPSAKSGRPPPTLAKFSSSGPSTGKRCGATRGDCGAVRPPRWRARLGGGREPLLAAGGRLNLVRVHIGQLLSWVGVAGQNSGTARLFGGPRQSQIGAGPGAEAQLELAQVAELAR